MGTNIAWVGFVVLCFLGGDAGAEREDALLAILRAPDDPEKLRSALRELRELGVESDRIDAALDRAETTVRREHAEAVAAVDELATALVPREEKLVAGWEQARAAAAAFILDPARYPDAEPPNWRSRGCETAVRLGRTAELLHRSVAEALGGHCRKALALDAERARSLGAALESTERLLLDVRESRGTARAAGAPPAPSPAARFALLLAEGDLRVAAKAYQSLEGSARLVAFHLYSRSIDERNDATMKKVSRTLRADFAALNAYRQALGRSPLSWNVALARAAEGHSAEMKKLGYFSHDSPNADRRTENQRAAAAGYSGGVAETIYANSSLPAAIGVWMQSASHHRTMLSGQWQEGGVGTVGPAVALYGAAADSPPVLVYP